MLDEKDFENWRKHLRSFIPELPSGGSGSGKRVYVTANDGKDLEAVDLTHLFSSSLTVGSLIHAVSEKVKQMQRDKVDQPGLIGMVMPSSESLSRSMGKRTKLMQLSESQTAMIPL